MIVLALLRILQHTLPGRIQPLLRVLASSDY
jgi:hypothetical protein